MLLAPIATTDPARGQLAQQFNDLAFEMTAIDGRMEQNAGSGNRVAPEWPGRFMNVSGQLSALRDGFVRLMPAQDGLAGALANHVRDISYMAGRLDAMVKDGDTYAGYWGQVMDGPIADARAAANLLFAG